MTPNELVQKLNGSQGSLESSAAYRLTLIELGIALRLNLVGDDIHKIICHLYRFSKEPRHLALMQDRAIQEWMAVNSERQQDIAHEMNSLPLSEDEAKGFREHQEKAWSQCCFCGATNGLYCTVLQEHSVRCRFIGLANDLSTMHPHYYKKIEEDDLKLLPLMRIQDELHETKSKLAKLEKAHANCAPVEEKSEEEEAKPSKRKHR